MPRKFHACAPAPGADSFEKTPVPAVDEYQGKITTKEEGF
jgi:hypothetical protein